MDASREPIKPTLPPVEKLANYFDDLMNLSQTMQRLDASLRPAIEMEVTTEPGTTKIRLPEGGYYARETSADFTDQPYEHVYLREADTHERNPFGFEIVETPNSASTWSGARFHIIRPLEITKGQSEEGFEGEMVTIGKPKRFVLFIAMPGDRPDQTYILHQNMAGDFRIDEYDLELMDFSDESVAEEIDKLLDEISASEGEDAIEPTDEDLAEYEFVEPHDRYSADVFAMSIFDHLSHHAQLHPFRRAA